MRKSKLLTAIILPVTVLVLALSFAIASARQLTNNARTPSQPQQVQQVRPPETDPVPPEDEPALPTETKPQDAAPTGFRVTVRDGKIAVFTLTDDKNPYRILDFDVSGLPDYDQELLSKGVILQSQEELAAFLEDFS